jgi:hypothetical protein
VPSDTQYALSAPSTARPGRAQPPSSRLPTTPAGRGARLRRPRGRLADAVSSLAARIRSFRVPKSGPARYLRTRYVASEQSGAKARPDQARRGGFARATALSCLDAV